MKQALYGFLLFVFLALPPVANLLESLMIFHMHMQMPLFIVCGFLIGRFFQLKFPRFFAKWNTNGVPGILLFTIITGYWMLIPRLMDEAIASPAVEWFKFLSLTLLAGVPLRDSWRKLGSVGKNVVYGVFIFIFLAVAGIYLGAKNQLCNNYQFYEQKELGFGTLFVAVCMIIFLIYLLFTDQSEFTEAKPEQDCANSD
ncbi:MAG TPA: hypothetical protein VF260_13135 [Bacilli bacterium]